MRLNPFRTVAATADAAEELQRRLAPETRRREDDSLSHVPQVVCADGLKMSVQASAYHYCQPRDSHGPWWSVEIGFPSREVPALRKWMEDWGDTKPTEAVYGYVPLDVVAQVIADAGGFADAAPQARTADPRQTEPREDQ